MPLTSTGFEKKRLDEFQEDLGTALKGVYGNDIDLEPDAPFGQLVAVLSNSLEDNEETMEAVYNALYPSSGSGSSLDRSSALVGVTRLVATASVMNGWVEGTQGTVIASGKIARQSESTKEFTLDTATTIDKADVIKTVISINTVSNTTLYTLTINGTGYPFTSDGTATAAEIIIGLIASVGASEPVTFTNNGDTMDIDSDDNLTPFSVSVSALLDIDSLYTPAEFTCTETGAIAVPEDSLDEIVTPVAGWDSVGNTLDGTIGRALETDAVFRLRRSNSLSVVGVATIEAIRSKILQEVDDVTGCIVINNKTDVTDGDGRPPHSFECVVTGGDQTEIVEKIFEVGGAGINSYGSISENVTDSMGFSHTIKMSRSSQIYCWFNVVLTYYTEETFPLDGITQVKEIIEDYGDTYQNVGVDVILQRIAGTVSLNVSGVAKAVITVATSATPAGPAGAYSGTDLAISLTEQANFDTSRIAVS